MKKFEFCKKKKKKKKRLCMVYTGGAYLHLFYILLIEPILNHVDEPMKIFGINRPHRIYRVSHLKKNKLFKFKQ